MLPDWLYPPFILSRLACLIWGHDDFMPGRCRRWACYGRIRTERRR